MLVSVGLMAVAAVGALAVPAQALAQGIKVENAAAMASARRLTVGSFAIAFLTDRVDRARAGGGLLGSGSGGNSTARSALAGLTDQDFQRATDAAYEDFLRQATAAGYEVVDRTPAEAALKKAGASAWENGVERDFILARNSTAKARLFAPSGWGGPFVPREWLGYFSGGGFSANRSAILMSTGGQAFARSNAQGVVSVLYVVDFAQADTYGGWFRNTSAVSVKAGLAVAPETSKVIVYAPNGKVVSATLDEPVAVGGDFGSFDDATSSGQKTAEALTNAIGALGGMGTNRSRRYTMTADPARWQAGVADLTAATTAQFLQGMGRR